MNTISTLNDADIDAAYEIELLCHAFPWSKKVFLSNQGKRYLNQKITINHQMVGFVICQLVLDEATIFNIAITPLMQKKGLASQLLAHLISELKKRNIQTLWLEVRKSNHRAIALYEKLGFNQITVRENYYKAANGYEDAIIMALTLI